MLNTNDNAKLQSEFMKRTETKSLYNQLKFYVDLAKSNFQNEISARRARLGKLIADEDKVYEFEFAESVKSRIDLDIKNRNEALYRNREDRKRNDSEFLDKKCIQRNIINCYEIRDAFRRRECEYTRLIQEEQILEKKRAIHRERELDKYWQEVDKVTLERAQECQRNEQCIKKKFMDQVKFILDRQVEEHAEQRKAERIEKLKDAKILAEEMKKINTEEFDRKEKALAEQQHQYRYLLLDAIEQKRNLKQLELQRNIDIHRKLMAQINQIELQETEAIRRKKQACRKATLAYIDYVQKTRQFEADRHRWRDTRIEGASKVDHCTKVNRVLEQERKAAAAKTYYDDLRKQICEDLERKLRQETELRNNGMTVNPYGDSERSRSQILAQYRKNRTDLDEQLTELQRIRAEESKVYEKGLMLAADDPVLCTALAEKYIAEHIDHLAPHANWEIIGCTAKLPSRLRRDSVEDEPPKGALQITDEATKTEMMTKM